MSSAITVVDKASRAICPSSGVCAITAGLLLAMWCSHIRRPNLAREALDGARAAGGRDANPKLSAALALVEAHVAAGAGQSVMASDLAAEGLRRAREADLRAWVPIGHYTLALSALRRGDLPTALAYAAELMEDAIFDRGMFPVGPSTWIVVQISELEKGREQAALLATEIIRSPEASGQLLTAEPAAAAWLVRLLTDAGDRESAAECLRVVQRLAADNPQIRSVEAAALHAAGVFYDDVETLRRAADTHLDPWAVASAMEDTAIALSRSPEGRAEAERLLERVLGLYADIGSGRDSLRVKKRLRRFSAGPGPGGPGPGSAARGSLGLPPSGLPALSDTEYAVAGLVAQGLTNAQAADQLFISHHTVAFHLRKIFRKLGVHSRVQLASTWAKSDGHGTADRRPAAPPRRVPLPRAPQIGT